MSSLSIVHISTEKGWRGGEQQVRLLTDGLLARGHRCTVLTPPDSALYKDRALLNMARPLKRRFGEFDPFAVRSLAGIAREVKADILHAQTSHAHALALPVSRMLGVPLVVSRRVDFPVGGNWLSRRKYLVPDIHYIAISEAVKQVLIESGIQPYQVSVVYSGVDPDRFEQRGETRDAAEAERWGASQGVPLLVNVAALTDHKDQFTLIHAASLLRDRGVSFRLMIAGSGELEQQLREQQQEARLQEHVHFAGYVQDVGSLLRAADIFVMSSHMEGLCTSILDAMSVGVPVVATEAGGIPEIVKHGKNGLLSRPRDAAGLADNIQKLLADQPLQQQFHLEGRRTVLSRFTNDSMVEGTLEAYATARRLQ